jgi:hypothetical protein
MNLIARLFPNAPTLRGRLTADGLVLLEERLRGSVTYRDYKAPGRRDTLTRRGARWAVGITRKGMLVDGSLGTFIDTVWTDPRLSAVQVSASGDELLVAFDASTFHDDRSGKVEIRAHSPNAQRFADLVAEHRAGGHDVPEDGPE